MPEEIVEAQGEQHQAYIMLEEYLIAPILRQESLVREGGGARVRDTDRDRETEIDTHTEN